MAQTQVRGIRVGAVLALHIPMLPSAPSVGLALALLAPAEAPPPSVDDAAQSVPPDRPQLPPVVAPLQNRCDQPRRNAKFQITIKREAELQDLVEWMMSVSCQKFIWSPGLRTKKVNIVAPEPVTMAEAYAAFHAALATIGATVEPAGDYYKIVESQEIPGANFPVYGPGATPPADDRFVTVVWRPDEAQREQAAAILGQLKTSEGQVQSIGDVVVVTDRGARIRTLQRLLRELEQPAGSHRKIHLFPVEHAEAEALAGVAQGVFASATDVLSTASAATRPTVKPAAKPSGASAKKKGRAKSGASAISTAANSTAALSEEVAITVDTRTATIIVVATDERYAAVERLLKELDVGAGEGHETLHVIELEHIDATEMEAVLTNLANPSATKKSGEGRAAAAAGSARVTGTVRVTAHPATQTLVVNATSSDFAALKRVVDRLDHPRRQLYIEVYLLEVRTELGRELGVKGHFARGTADGGMGFVSNSPTSTGGTLDSSLLSNLSAGLLGPLIPGSGALLGDAANDIPAFGLTLQAMETQEDVDIVAEPHLYAAENEEAVAEFGETVPVRTGTTTLPGSTTATIDNVSDKDVKLKLQVKPYVADDESIALDILLEDHQLGALDADTGNYRTLTRKLDLKKVVAHPGQPLVLGGLSREVERVSDSGVPGLRNVPLLGWLFRKRQRGTEKVNLLMVMVPHIIESPDDARQIHITRMKERAEFIERYTAFKRRGTTRHINYRKTSGVLSALNVASERQTADAVLAQAAEDELALTRTSVTIDPRGVTPPPTPPATDEAAGSL